MPNDNRLELYKQGLNDSAIADIIGISQEAVSAWRRRQGLPPNKKRRYMADKRFELHAQGLTDEEIAERVGVRTETITSWRSRHKLKSNGIYKTKMSRKNKPDMPEPTKEKQRGWALSGTRIKDNRWELYKKGLTDEEIAREVGCSKKTISNWRYRHRLPSNTKKEP